MRLFAQGFAWRENSILRELPTRVRVVRTATVRVIAQGDAAVVLRLCGEVVTNKQLLRAQRARGRAAQRSRESDDRFALLVLQAREEGRTVRELAEVLGIGASTVQDWTNRGRQLRG